MMAKDSIRVKEDASGAELPQKKRKRVVSAGNCPLNAKHGPGRVYRTNGRVRYCVCDECGETWTKAGPPAQEEEDGD